MLGMISTHWRQPHQAEERDLRLLDVLARQAADLIERRESEEVLRESERRFRAMIDALPAAIYTTDAEGRLTHFNPAAVEFSGRTPELGTDQWCVSFKLYHPDGRPMAHDECPMAITLKEGRVVRGTEAIAERPDGTRVWFAPYPTPLRDSAGKIVGGINMLLDISERKQAEAILRQREVHLQRLNETLVSVLGAIPEIVFVTGRSGGIEFKNAAAEHFTRGASVNAGLPAPLESELQRVLATGECHLPTSLRLVHRFPINGTERYFLSRIVGMMTPEKQTFGAVVMLQDVTEFRLLDQVKTDLISTVSHELKTPLTSLQTALVLLLEPALGTLNGKQIEMVSIARDEAERLVRTLNALLDLTRFEETTLGLSVETTAEALIRSSVEQTAIGAEEARVLVKAKLDPNLPALKLDPERIIHVLTNFLTNAIKYSPAHSTVLIQARQHHEGVYFSVVDHGPGVPKPYQSRIFEKFFRVPGTTKKGAGLGLAIARECVSAHRGRIGVRSEDGQGSEFYCILPTK
jgi:PAS domain S-box-containing protein